MTKGGVTRPVQFNWKCCLCVRAGSFKNNPRKINHSNFHCKILVQTQNVLFLLKVAYLTWITPMSVTLFNTIQSKLLQIIIVFSRHFISIVFQFSGKKKSVIKTQLMIENLLPSVLVPSETLQWGFSVSAAYGPCPVCSSHRQSCHLIAACGRTATGQRRPLRVPLPARRPRSLAAWVASLRECSTTAFCLRTRSGSQLCLAKTRARLKAAPAIQGSANLKRPSRLPHR